MIAERGLSEKELRKLKKKMEKEKNVMLDDRMLDNADFPDLLNPIKAAKVSCLRRKRSLTAELKTLKSKHRAMKAKTYQDKVSKKQVYLKIKQISEELANTKLATSVPVSMEL